MVALPPLAAPVLSGYIVLMSLILHGLMWHDKKAASRRARRVRERTLLRVAVAGGAPGGWLAMSLHRHKTRHKRFRILFPALSIVWFVLLVIVWTL